jgi:hypothetical protein
LFLGDEVITQGSYALAHASPGSGLSLKEALDAAHGHEHNEDGSEMSPDQKAAHDAHVGDGASGRQGSRDWTPLLIAAGFGFLAFLQLLWNRKNVEKEDNS